uniref:Uncharacterized protein n=1 Tax=Denticeps clupeoides TaxID=299321 RepID=A0AAY4D1Z6_9TELE
MSEPGGKRLRSSLPACRAHRAALGSGRRQNLPAAVEEGLCGVATFLAELAYRLEALAKIFEQDSVALPRAAAFFHAMLDYLNQRGGLYCGKDIKCPGCEGTCALLPALELTLVQRKEQMAVMAELSQLAREHGDAHTAGVVRSRFLAPLAPRVKRLGDLVTNARRLGPGWGEYLMERLQDEMGGD